MDEITFEVTDGAAVITLNRPDFGNSLSEDMRTLIREYWKQVDANPDVVAAIVVGAGEKHFSTGADVGRLKKQNTERNPEDMRKEGPGGWSSRHYKVKKPVICAVNGLVAGGGLHFVVDADIVLATESAVFVDTHVNVGQVGALENIGLAKRMPMGTALRMTLIGKSFRLPAQRAYQLGLVDELYPTRDAMLQAAKDMVKIMAANSPMAMVLSKQAIWNSLDMSESEALKHGWDLICDMRAHPDAKEGPRAFGEKRAPNWVRQVN